SWYTSSRASFLSSLFVYLSLLRWGSHSFPTRRSSDLERRKTQRSWNLFCWPCQNSISKTWTRNPPQCSGRGMSRPSNSNSGRARSEEHTSELQSRFDLVCRLLLEKKNKKH